jgi:hypothetical protein
MSVHSFFVAAISISSIVAHRRKLQFHSRNALLQPAHTIERPRLRRLAIDEEAIGAQHAPNVRSDVCRGPVI